MCKCFGPVQGRHSKYPLLLSFLHNHLPLLRKRSKQSQKHNNSPPSSKEVHIVLNKKAQQLAMQWPGHGTTGVTTTQQALHSQRQPVTNAATPFFSPQVSCFFKEHNHVLSEQDTLLFYPGYLFSLKSTIMSSLNKILLCFTLGIFFL